jgi:four helix bundle protein
MKRNSKVYGLAFAFSVEIVKLYRVMQCRNEFVLSKQILKSGTSIGANIREALEAFSKKEFIAKMSISLKESGETEYWLDLLEATGEIELDTYDFLMKKNNELRNMLNAIIKTSRENL